MPIIFSFAGLKKYFVERVAKLAAERNLGLMGWEDAFMDQDGNPFHLDQIGNKDMTAYPWDNIWEWGASQRAYKLANAGYKVSGSVPGKKGVRRFSFITH